jgi:hypothetical protein
MRSKAAALGLSGHNTGSGAGVPAQREVQGGVAGLAQKEEHRPRNAGAACSSDAARTIDIGI